MARYQVQHRYRSNEYGPWEPDTYVELEPAEAKWVNHDSPGTLTQVDPDEQAKAKRAKQAKAAATAKDTGPEHEIEQTLVDGTTAKPDMSSPALKRATED